MFFSLQSTDNTSNYYLSTTTATTVSLRNETLLRIESYHYVLTNTNICIVFFSLLPEGVTICSSDRRRKSVSVTNKRQIQYTETACEKLDRPPRGPRGTGKVGVLVGSKGHACSWGS
jgi:hypothetical protein